MMIKIMRWLRNKRFICTNELMLWDYIQTLITRNTEGAHHLRIVPKGKFFKFQHKQKLRLAIKSNSAEIVADFHAQQTCHRNFKRRLRNENPDVNPRNRSKRSNAVLPLDLRRDLATDSAISAQDTARSFGVGRTAVSENRQLFAFTAMGLQLRRDESDSRGPLDYCFEFILFDGTQQTVAVKFDPLLPIDAQISKWEIMIIRRLISYGTEDGDDHMVELACQPVACLGKCANTIHDCLRVFPPSRLQSEFTQKPAGGNKNIIYNMREWPRWHHGTIAPWAITK